MFRVVFVKPESGRKWGKGRAAWRGEGGGAKGFFEESLEKSTHMAHKHAQYEEKSKERVRLLCRLQLGPETEGQ